MPLAEYHSWIDFYTVEPWGDFRADLRTGLLATVIVRMLGAKGSRAKPLDFMPIIARQVERSRDRAGDPGAEVRAYLDTIFHSRRPARVLTRKAHHG